MKRLTERDEYGNADIVALSDMMPELYAGLSFAEANALTAALNRLAAYEDTGLEPDDVTDMMASLGTAIGQLTGYRMLGSVDHLRELVQAEKERRLVVLPCKVGDVVYIPDCTKKIAVQVRVQGISVTSRSLVVLHFGGYPAEFAWGDRCGKDWFLTYEEAEEALKGDMGVNE